jgi:hypothetical protein
VPENNHNVGRNTFEILTKVLESKSSTEMGGSNDNRDSIALGPDNATAGTPACAPVMIERPPPSEWPVTPTPEYVEFSLRKLTNAVVSL